MHALLKFIVLYIEYTQERSLYKFLIVRFTANSVVQSCGVVVDVALLHLVTLAQGPLCRANFQLLGQIFTYSVHMPVRRPALQQIRHKHQAFVCFLRYDWFLDLKPGQRGKSVDRRFA